MTTEILSGLAVELGLDAKKFTAGLAQSLKELQAFQDKVAKQTAAGYAKSSAAASQAAATAKKAAQVAGAAATQASAAASSAMIKINASLIAVTKTATAVSHAMVQMAQSTQVAGHSLVKMGQSLVVMGNLSRATADRIVIDWARVQKAIGGPTQGRLEYNPYLRKMGPAGLLGSSGTIYGGGPPQQRLGHIPQPNTQGMIPFSGRAGVHQGAMTLYDPRIRERGDAARKHSVDWHAPETGSWTKFEQALSGVDNIAVRLGQDFQRLGRQMTLYVTAPIALGAGLSVHEFAKFDDAMVKSTAIMDGLSDSTKKNMRSVALDISSVTSTKPEELAKGYYYLASAGYDAAQAMKALPIVEKFARAGAFNLDEATELVTQSLGALGLASENAAERTRNMTKVANELTYAGVKSQATVRQLAIALTNDAAAAARIFGQSMESVISTLMVYADQGIKSESAGGDFARTIRYISKAALENADAFKAHNIVAIDEASGQYRQLAEIVGDLEIAFKDMTGPQRAAALESMGFEARLQMAILPLIGMSDKMKKFREELTHTNGYLNSVAGKQMESFTAQMAMFRNELSRTGIEIGEKLSPYIRALAGEIRGWSESWRGLSDIQKEVSIGVAGIAAAIGPLIFATSGYIIVLAKLKDSIAALGGVGLAAGAARLGLAGAVGSLAVAMVYGAKRVWEYAMAVDKLNAGAAKSAQIGRDISEVQKSNSGKVISEINDTSKTPEERKSRLDQAARLALKRRNELEARVNRDNEDLLWWKSHQGLEGSKIGTATASANADESTEQFDSAVDHHQAVLEEMDRKDWKPKEDAKGDAPRWDADAKELTQYTEKLVAQAKAYKDVTATAKILELEQSMLEKGMKKIDVDTLVAGAKSALEKENAAKSESDIKKYLEGQREVRDHLQEEIDLRGQAKHAIERHVSAMKGVTDENKKTAKEHDESIFRLKEQTKATNYLADAEERIAKIEADAANFGEEHHNFERGYRESTKGDLDPKELERMKGLDVREFAAVTTKKQKQDTKAAKEKEDDDIAATIKKHRPAVQEFVEQQKKLQGWLRANRISAAVYNEALKDLAHTLHGDFTPHGDIEGSLFDVGAVRAAQVQSHFTGSAYSSQTAVATAGLGVGGGGNNFVPLGTDNTSVTPNVQVPVEATAGSGIAGTPAGDAAMGGAGDSGFVPTPGATPREIEKQRRFFDINNRKKAFADANETKAKKHVEFLARMKKMRDAEPEKRAKLRAKLKKPFISNQEFTRGGGGDFGPDAEQLAESFRDDYKFTGSGSDVDTDLIHGPTRANPFHSDIDAVRKASGSNETNDKILALLEKISKNTEKSAKNTTKSPTDQTVVLKTGGLN